MITALNKIDLLDDKMWLEKLKRDFANPVAISAKLRQNLDLLLEKIQENFAARMVKLEIIIPHTRMDLVDLFYREGKVEHISYIQKGIKIKLNLPKVLSQKLLNNREIERVN
jgi:50S ribosomal subunit-associated GTPase HflX